MTESGLSLSLFLSFFEKLKGPSMKTRIAAFFLFLLFSSIPVFNVSYAGFIGTVTGMMARPMRASESMPLQASFN